MPDLEGEVAELYSAYVSELGAALDELEPWWERLIATLGRKAIKLRWPAGVASHPRVLAIYRDYHRRFSALGPAPRGGSTPRFDDDAAWGSEAEGAPDQLIPPAPERLLIERLSIEAPKLHAKLAYLVMSPIGVSPEPRPSMRTLQIVEADTHRPQAFDFELRHGTQRGLERLLGAGFDLRAGGFKPVALEHASEFHRLAYNSYLRALGRALAQVERWWARVVDEHLQRGADSAARALERAFADHLFGPVGHPQVIGVIQAYWALCHEINAALTEIDRHVAPEQMLLGWLRDERHQTWVDVLTAMPYWPVGLDRAGRWS
ncbi:hypothetical protein [Enhygromyxa salina]|nr:hypothetical protein [Enhygromyxa salina]